uniref:Uncharacterized protein n=1 Tax=Anguilla anguilla TaxID=7936 RepID=A0A0E9WVL7_ANGAN
MSVTIDVKRGRPGQEQACDSLRYLRRNSAWREALRRSVLKQERWNLFWMGICCNSIRIPLLQSAEGNLEY